MSDSVAAGATPEDVGGQLTEDMILGYRVTGPDAGMVLVNLPDDPGLQESLDAGDIIIPNTPLGEDTTDGGDGGNSRVPSLTSVSPSTADHTVTEFTIDLVGTDFADGDKVFSDDLEATTVTFVDDGNLTAAFTGVSVETARDVDITVKTSEGEVSNAVTFSFT